MSLILGILDSGGAAAGGGTAYESIASATGTGSSGTITFSSIPATYSHLQIRILGRNLYSAGSSARSLWFTFNSDTSNSYPVHRLYGDGSAASAEGFTATGSGGTSFLGWAMVDSGATASVYATTIMDIHDYASTSKYKTVRSISGADLNGSGRIYLNSSVWMSTSAITSITFEDQAGGGFSTGTTFALYGIKG
jgi:hypothetical protein